MQALGIIPETDATINQFHRINRDADQEEGVLYASDPKATLKASNYSRGGYSRQKQTACDHDSEPDDKLTQQRHCRATRLCHPCWFEYC